MFHSSFRQMHRNVFNFLFSLLKHYHLSAHLINTTHTMMQFFHFLYKKAICDMLYFFLTKELVKELYRNRC